MDFRLPTPHSITLPNGFRLVDIQDNSHPVLCLQLYIKTGSIYENPKQRGYSHFLEHLVFKSTRDFPNNGISRQVAELGGMLNAYTDYDSTCFYLLLPSEHLQSGLYILSQLARQADFSESDVETEKKIIIEEIKQYRNDPEPDHIEWIQTRHFRKSPLKYPVLGTEKSVTTASWAALKSFLNLNYCPQNSYLVVCGDFEQAILGSLVVDYFGAWQATRLTRDSRSNLEPEISLGSYRFRKKSSAEDTLSFVVPELSEQHPQADALHIAMRYFAIGRASRLFKKLVEEKHLCSSVKVSSLSGLLSGASVVMCFPLSRAFIPEIVACFGELLLKLLEQGIPPEDIRLIQKDIVHSWLFSFEGMENLANLVAVEESLGNLNRLHDYGNKILAVSPDQINQAIRTYWQPRYVEIFGEGRSPFKGIKDKFREMAQQSFSPAQFIPDPLSLGRAGLMAGSGQQEFWLDGHSEENPKLDSAVVIPEASAQKIELIAENHYQIILSNGMKVIFRRMPNKSITGVSISTRLSQLCESSGQAGLNYFASSLILYSTQLHSHAELMKAGREYGFNLRVIHHLDSTSIRGKCLNASLPKALSILSELITQPRLDREHFNLLKATALDSIRRDNDYPVSYAYQRWFRMLVGMKTNLFRSSGDPQMIRQLKLRDIEAWLGLWGLASDFSLALVGNGDPQWIAELCEGFFGGVSKPGSLSPLPFLEESQPREYIQKRETDQAIIHLGGFACPARNREENAAFYVLSQLVGGDISSRFYDILRERHGLAYQTGFDFSSINELGFWNAYAFCDKRHYKRCIALMQEMLHNLCSCEVSEAELRAAQNYLIGMNRFDLESASYSAASISNLSALGYEPEYYLLREQRIRAVDAPQIKHIALKYLSPDKHYLHVLV